MNTSKRKGHAYFSGLLEGHDYVEHEEVARILFALQ